MNTVAPKVDPTPPTPPAFFTQQRREPEPVVNEALELNKRKTEALEKIADILPDMVNALVDLRSHRLPDLYAGTDYTEGAEHA